MATDLQTHPSVGPGRRAGHQSEPQQGCCRCLWPSIDSSGRSLPKRMREPDNEVRKFTIHISMQMCFTQRLYRVIKLCHGETDVRFRFTDRSLPGRQRAVFEHWVSCNQLGAPSALDTSQCGFSAFERLASRCQRTSHSPSKTSQFPMPELRQTCVLQPNHAVSKAGAPNPAENSIQTYTTELKFKHEHSRSPKYLASPACTDRMARNPSER